MRSHKQIEAELQCLQQRMAQHFEDNELLITYALAENLVATLREHLTLKRDFHKLYKKYHAHDSKD